MEEEYEKLEEMLNDAYEKQMAFFDKMLTSYDKWENGIAFFYEFDKDGCIRDVNDCVETTECFYPLGVTSEGMLIGFRDEYYGDTFTKEDCFRLENGITLGTYWKYDRTNYPTINKLFSKLFNA